MALASPPVRLALRDQLRTVFKKPGARGKFQTTSTLRARLRRRTIAIGLLIGPNFQQQNRRKMRYISAREGAMSEKPPKKIPFSVVTALPLQVPDPPRPLGPAGLALWQAVQAEYNIEDRGGVAG